MKRAGIMGNSKPKRKKSAAAETRKLTPQQDSGIRKREKKSWLASLPPVGISA